MGKNLALEIAIKAKNLASAAFDKVKDSLTSTSTSATKTEKSLDDLGKQLDDIGQNRAVIDEFKLLNEEIDTSEEVVRKLKTELTDYEKQAADAGNDTAEFKQEVTRLKTEIEKAETAIKGKRFELDKTVKSLKDADINTDELKRAEKELAAQANKTRQEIAEKNRALNNTKPSAVTGSAGIASLTKTVVGLGAAYVGVDKLFDSLRSIFTTGDKFEKLRIQFEGLMGSVEAGEQATAWVKDFTKNTPLQLEEVSQVFVKLKSFGIDPMNGSLQAITDQAFKLGGGFQEVEGISLALGQAWAKQKLQGEEILQLIERGVPVWELLEKATGKNTQELQKLSTEGKLGRDVIQQLMDTIAKEAEGSAAKNMSTLSGLISNAKDNLAQFYNEISEAGAMDWLKEQLADVNARFKQMAEDGTLKKWAKDISDAIINIGEGIKSTISFLVEYRKEIAAVVTAWAALKVGSFFKNVVSGAAAGIAALSDFVKRGIQPTNIEIDKATSKTGKLNTLLGRAGLVGSALIAVKGLYDLGAAYFENRKAQDALNTSIEEGQKVRLAASKELLKIADDTGIYYDTLKEAIAAQESGNLVLDESTNKWVYHAEGVEKSKEALKQANSELAETQAAALKAIDAIGSTSKEWIKNEGSVEKAREALNKHIEALEKDMPVGAQRAIDELRRLRGEMDKQIEKNTELEEAYKLLGIESPAALKKTSDAAADAFKKVTEDTTASKEKISEAFEKMVESAQKYADATGTTLPPTIHATAAANGLTSELNELIKKHKEASDATDDLGKSNKDAKKPVDDLTDALQKQLDVQTKLNNERKDYNADNSRKDLTESRTLTTQGADYSQMDNHSLRQKLAEFNRGATENSFPHMKEYYATEADKIRKQIDENTQKFIDEGLAAKQKSNSQKNASSPNTSSSVPSSNSVSVPSVIQAPARDSQALYANTEALNKLTFAVDSLNFTIQGASQESDFLSQLEDIERTS